MKNKVKLLVTFYLTIVNTYISFDKLLILDQLVHIYSDILILIQRLDH